METERVSGFAPFIGNWPSNQPPDKIIELCFKDMRRTSGFTKFHTNLRTGAMRHRQWSGETLPPHNARTKRFSRQKFPE